MKILLSVGHSVLKNGNCTSADGRAYGGILEYEYNKSIVNRIAEYLGSAGHEVRVMICPEGQFTTSKEEKTYKLPIANSGSYDLVVELHLNASKYHNACGSEVYYISQKGKEVAERINAQLAAVFKNRGAQYNDNLYMLNSTKPVAVLVESFFCDHSGDCELAAKTDVARLIAQGICGAEIQPMEETKEETQVKRYEVRVGDYLSRNKARKVRNKLRKLGYTAAVKRKL